MFRNFKLQKACDSYSKVVTAYKTYIQNQHHLPKSSSNFLEYVIKNNIYNAYSSIEGIEQVLFHLSHRIKHGVMLNESIALFKANEKELEINFELLFKDAVTEFL